MSFCVGVYNETRTGYETYKEARTNGEVELYEIRSIL